MLWVSAMFRTIVPEPNDQKLVPKTAPFECTGTVEHVLPRVCAPVGCRIQRCENVEANSSIIEL
jgi:hypothetical protein